MSSGTRLRRSIDLGLDAVLGRQRVGRLEGVGDGRAPGDERHVRALAARRAASPSGTRCSPSGTTPLVV